MWWRLNQNNHRQQPRYDNTPFKVKYRTVQHLLDFIHRTTSMFITKEKICQENREGEWKPDYQNFITISADHSQIWNEKKYCGKSAWIYAVSKSSKGDSKNSEPADSDSIFFLVENSIFCFTEFVNIKKTTRIIHKWFCGNRLVGNVVLTLKPGKRWRTWSRKSFKNCRGEWKIQICESKGKIIAEKKFIVKKI